MTRALVALCCLVLVGCIGRLPAEQPIRILEQVRSIDVVVVSRPSGVALYSETLSPLGHTPTVIDRLPITKEIWKHGDDRPPPPPPSDRVLRRASGVGQVARSATGDGLSWIVVADVAGHRRRFELTAPLTELERAFTTGRLELVLDGSVSR